MGLTIFTVVCMITMQISTQKIQYACLVYQSIPCCTEQNMFGYLQYIQCMLNKKNKFEEVNKCQSTFDQIKWTHLRKTQEKSPEFLYSVLKNTVLIFKCTVQFL